MTARQHSARKHNCLNHTRGTVEPVTSLGLMMLDQLGEVLSIGEVTKV